MAENPTRWIWIDEAAQGPFTVDQLYRMAKHKEVNYDTLFWSEEKQKWNALPGLIFDLEPSNVEEMARTGINTVQVLGPGEEVCDACAYLVDKVFPIYSSPLLPPDGCRCTPWCRLCIVAVDD